jgi:hypothetical protein
MQGTSTKPSGDCLAQFEAITGKSRHRHGQAPLNLFTSQSTKFHGLVRRKNVSPLHFAENYWRGGMGVVGSRTMLTSKVWSP